MSSQAGSAVAADQLESGHRNNLGSHKVADPLQSSLLSHVCWVNVGHKHGFLAHGMVRDKGMAHPPGKSNKHREKSSILIKCFPTASHG